VAGAPAGALHAEHDEAARAEAPEVGQAHGRAQLAQLALLPRPVGHGAQRVQLRTRARVGLGMVSGTDANLIRHREAICALGHGAQRIQLCARARGALSGTDAGLIRH